MRTYAIVIVAIVLRCLSGIYGSSDNNEVNLVIDVIRSYDRPTALMAKVCWKSAMKVDLMVRLGNLHKPTTVSFVENGNVNVSLPEAVIVIVDMRCPGLEYFFREAHESNKFKNPLRWLIIGKPANKSPIVPTELQDITILFDTEVLVSHCVSNEACELYFVYKIKSSSPWFTEYFGSWSASNGLIISKTMGTSMAMRRKNFAKESIATSFAITDERTKHNLNDFANQVDDIAKCGFRQTIPLYDFLNATRVNLFTNTWGYYINGSWNGMIRSLIQGEAELSGTIMYMTSQRIEVVTFLASLFPLSVVFVFREPPLSYHNNLFLLPFESTVWFCLAGFVVVLLLVLYISARWEIKILKNDNHNKKEEKTRVNVSDIALMVMSAISQQGSHVELKGSFGRIVTFILFLAFLFLFTSYSASIVVLLQSSSNQIRTLSDLLNSKLQLGVEDTTYNRYYFTTATDPVRKAIYETKVAPRGSKDNFMNIDEGVKRLQNNPFAFFMPTATGYRLVEKYFQEHEKCGLQEIPFLPFYKTWLSCRKNSPYTEIFKVGFARIIEHGLSVRESRLIFARKPVCAVRGGSFDSVDIIDIYPVLLMLLYGMILAIGMMLFEIIYHRFRSSQRITGTSDLII